MPLVPFDTLPDSARVWVFGSDRPLDDTAAARLLAEVERFLERWHAHGSPLYSSRDWRHRHFLTIAVDQSTVGASGCSIDGLFRALRPLESAIGAQLLSAGLVFYRDGDGHIQAVDRGRFTEDAAAGVVSLDTTVFDLTVDTLGQWRERFEGPAHRGWHGSIVERALARR